MDRLLAGCRGGGGPGRAGRGGVGLGSGPRAVDRPPQRERLLAEGKLVAVQIEGRREVRHIPAEDERFLDQGERELAAGEPPGGVPPQVALIAPLDPLVWDRRLLRDLFGFDYLWEGH